MAYRKDHNERKQDDAAATDPHPPLAENALASEAAMVSADDDDAAELADRALGNTMETRGERENGKVTWTRACSLANPLAVIAAHDGAAAVTDAAPADADPTDLEALRSAARWLEHRAVRKDLMILAGRLTPPCVGVGMNERRAEVSPREVEAHTLELLVVGYANGFCAGHARGHKTGRVGAATDEQVSHLSAAERRAYQAMLVRDASIRNELAALLGLPAEASWEKLLAALDTMRAAAKMVAHLIGGAK